MHFCTYTFLKGLTESDFPSVDRRTKPSLQRFRSSTNVRNHNTEYGSTPRRPLRKVRAIHDFTGQDPEELSFKKGDIIHLQETDKVPWGRGFRQVDGKEGWFPMSYIEVSSSQIVYGCYASNDRNVLANCQASTNVKHTNSTTRINSSNRQFERHKK